MDSNYESDVDDNTNNNSLNDVDRSYNSSRRASSYSYFTDQPDISIADYPDLESRFSKFKSTVHRVFHPFGVSPVRDLSEESLHLIQSSNITSEDISLLNSMFNGIKSLFSATITRDDFTYLFGDYMKSPFIDFIWFLYDICLRDRITWNEFFLTSLLIIFARPKHLLDIIFNILDTDSSDTLSENQITTFFNSLPSLPNNLPPTYRDIVEKYEYESTTILTRGGFYKLVHDFTELVEPMYLFHKILYSYLFKNYTPEQLPIMVDVRPFISRYYLRITNTQLRSISTSPSSLSQGIMEESTIPLQSHTHPIIRSSKSPKYFYNRYDCTRSDTKKSDPNLDYGIINSDAITLTFDSYFVASDHSNHRLPAENDSSGGTFSTRLQTSHITSNNAITTSEYDSSDR